MSMLPLLADAAANVSAQESLDLGDMWRAIVSDFHQIGSASALAALLQVLMIDVVLAGDNAIVVGALAAALPADQRKQGDRARCALRHWCCGSPSR